MKNILLACLLLIVLCSACQPVIPGTRDRGTPVFPGALTQVGPGSPGEYADVRGTDLRLSTGLDRVRMKTFWFNGSTRWPAAAEVIASGLIEEGKNPGLGVRKLHEQGIIGKGVNVAIIDQNLVWPIDHPEFQGKIVQYRDFGTKQADDTGSMHGPAVTSLLVGDTTGTAPGARVYYASVPSWEADAQYYADALDWIVAQNLKLPQKNQIRVVSVSAGPSGEGSLFKKNGDAWDAAYQRATQAGVLVLDCTEHHRVLGSCYIDLDNPESPTGCTPGYPGEDYMPKASYILVPTSPRTTAEEYVQGLTGYQFTGKGGLSWAVPYLSGVLAMGWQIRPDLTGPQMLDLLFQSAAQRDGMHIIDPAGFIEKVKGAAGQ